VTTGLANTANGASAILGVGSNPAGGLFGGPGSGFGTGFGGLNAANVAAGFNSLSIEDRGRIARRCSSIMSSPKGHDRESIAVCRILAAR
jgi:hypothetical protein